MITLFDILVSNDYKNCGIAISCVNRGSSTPQAYTSPYVQYSRRESGTTTWSTIGIFELKGNTSFSHSVLDVTSVSQKKYDYMLQVMEMDGAEASEIQYEIIYGIECDFGGLLISDGTEHYVAHLDCKTETTRNNSVQYIQTIANKYPHVVYGSKYNYTTGSSEGLFAPLNDSCEFEFEYTHDYSNKVLDFLTNQKPKVLKTHDGQIWLVSIDSNPQEVYSEFAGDQVIKFNWTEIGDKPTSGLVVLQ